MNKHAQNLRAVFTMLPEETRATFAFGAQLTAAADEIDRLDDLATKAQAAEREACAKLCEEIVTYPPGHGGQWEGYGEVKCTRDGKACAAAIRARS